MPVVEPLVIITCLSPDAVEKKLQPLLLEVRGCLAPLVQEGVRKLKCVFSFLKILEDDEDGSLGALSENHQRV